MKELAIRLQKRALLLVVPGVVSLWEVGEIPAAAVCAALLASMGIYLLRYAEAKQAA